MKPSPTITVKMKVVNPNAMSSRPIFLHRLALGVKRLDTENVDPSSAKNIPSRNVASTTNLRLRYRRNRVTGMTKTADTNKPSRRRRVSFSPNSHEF